MDHSLLFESGLFTGSLFLMVISSFVLTTALERVGVRLHFSESLLGIVTALGADAPEISSAITALAAGHHDLGIGVVLGSNVFNLAALLGVSALVAGRVRAGRAGLLLDGGIALIITLMAAALLAGAIPAWLFLLLIGMLMVPYIWVSSLSQLAVQALQIPESIRDFLARAHEETRDDSKTGTTASKATLFDVITLVPTLFAIVAASQGLVSSTVALAGHFALPQTMAGTLGVAALTGIPNAIAAVRLARRGRGAAVVTETFNSNTLNIIAGIGLPAIITGLGTVSSGAFFALWWLVGMSVIAILLTAWRGGLNRISGSILIVLYGAFAALIAFGGIKTLFAWL
jgi:cation:H+ antiporter